LGRDGQILIFLRCGIHFRFQIACNHLSLHTIVAAETKRVVGDLAQLRDTFQRVQLAFGFHLGDLGVDIDFHSSPAQGTLLLLRSVYVSADHFVFWDGWFGRSRHSDSDSQYGSQETLSNSTQKDSFPFVREEIHVNLRRLPMHSIYQVHL